MSVVRCKGCGTENPAGATYCSGCARPLSASAQQAVVEQRAAHTATGIRWPAIVIAALIVAIIIVLVVLVVTGTVIL